MQTQPRPIEPNDRILLNLPARLVNVVWEVFRNHPGLPVPYWTTHELLSEIGTQANQQPQMPQRPVPNGEMAEVTPGVNFDAARNPG